MAENVEIKDAAKVAEAVKLLNDGLERSSDYARQLSDHFENVYKNISKDRAAFNDFSKNILSNTDARRAIESEIESSISRQRRSMLALMADQKAMTGDSLTKHLEEVAKALDDINVRSLKGDFVEPGEFEAAAERQKELNDLIKKYGSSASYNVSKLKESIAIEENKLKLLNSQVGAWAHIKENNYAALGPAAGFAKMAETALQTIKKIGLPLIILAGLVKLGIDRFMALDKAAADFRKETGLTNTQMEGIRVSAEKLNRQFADIGISIEASYKSAKALFDVFGRTSLVTDEAMKNVALMANNLGVANEDAANVLATFQGLGGTTQDVAMNVIKAGAALSEKTGVPFSMVMKDVANASGETLELLGANPSALMKSAIMARSLGTDLNKLAATQKRLLDFTSSINDELSASALLGKSITFQKARQLAYEGDVAGAAKATLESVKAAGDFNKMNLYQREALAKASGMDLKDLTKMLAVDKQRQDILNGTDEAKKKQLLTQDAELERLKKMSDLNESNLIEEGEKQIQQQKMQSMVEKLTAAWQSLAITAGEALEPLFSALVSVIIPALKVVGVLLKFAVWPIKSLAELAASFGKHISNNLSPLTTMRNVVEWIADKISSLFENTKEGMGSLSTWIGAGLGVLGLLFFGKGGFSLLRDKLVSSFSFVKEGAKSLMSRFIGGPKGGLASSVADKAMDGAGKVTESASKMKGGGLGAGISNTLRGIAEGIAAFGNPKVLGGVAVLGLMTGVIWLLSKALGGFADLSWETIGKGLVAVAGFGALAALLSLAAVPIAIGAGVIALLGLSLIPFAAAAIGAGLGLNLLSEGIKNSVEPITRLSEVDLTKTAIGIGAVALALTAFGSGTAAAGLGSFVGNFLGGDPISKLEKLASMGDQLKLTAESIGSISESVSQFAAVDQFSKSVDTLTLSLEKLNEQLAEVSLLKLAAITAAGAVSSATAPASGMSTKGIEDKLDNLANLLTGGHVAVYMDGSKVSSTIAATAGR